MSLCIIERDYFYSGISYTLGPSTIERLSSSLCTVEPLNKGHIGTSHFVHYREVVQSLDLLCRINLKGACFLFKFDDMSLNILYSYAHGTRKGSKYVIPWLYVLARVLCVVQMGPEMCTV